MTKNKQTLIKSTIFLITVILLCVMRLVANYLGDYLSDNWLGWVFSFVFQVVCLGVIPMVLYTVWLKKSPKEMLANFKIKKPSGTLVLIGIVAGVLLFFATMGVSSIWRNILDSIGYQYNDGVGTIYDNVGVLIMELIMTAMLPGFFEEFVDRGLLLDTYSSHKSKTFVIFIIALTFGAVHQNIMQFGYACFGGFIFAYLALKYDSIVPGMIAHFMNNAFGTIISYSMQKENAIGAYYEALVEFLNRPFVFQIVFVGAIVGLIALGRGNKRRDLIVRYSKEAFDKGFMQLSEHLAKYIKAKNPSLDYQALLNMNLSQFFNLNAFNPDYITISTIDIDLLLQIFTMISDGMDYNKKMLYFNRLMFFKANGLPKKDKDGEAPSPISYLPIYVGIGIAIITTFLPFIISLI